MAWLRVDEPSSCAGVRRRAAALARQAGLAVARVDEVSIVASELASNLVKHAGGGWVLLRLLREEDRAGIGVLTLDAGPGTRDIEGFVTDGRTTSGTLGIGLGAVRRLADTLALHSVPGVGTVASAEFWRPMAVADEGAPPPQLDTPAAVESCAGITRPVGGEVECGDAFAWRDVPGGRVVMVADGLGHGALAAKASGAAVRTFLASTTSSPLVVLTEMQAALASTRGAAVAVAAVDHGTGQVCYAGVGNIAGRVVGPTRSSALPSQPGIVGHNAPRVREVEQRLSPGEWLLMHTDGLTDRWSLADLPGLLGSAPVVVAAALLRAAGVRRDDAGVLALRLPAAGDGTP